MVPMRTAFCATAFLLALVPLTQVAKAGDLHREQGSSWHAPPIHLRAHPHRPMPHADKHVRKLAPVPIRIKEVGNFAVQRAYECTLTAYGPGYISTGKRPGDPGYGITASGKVAKPRHTIAVDPGLIPLGSRVFIKGVGYRVAEDVGGAIKGRHIDVFFSNDDEAVLFGVKQHVKVYLLAKQ